MKLQDCAFKSVQVKLANELQKPLFLHCRDAAERFGAVLQEQELSVPAVAHCFTGSREELMQYIEMGLHIGITGWVSSRPLVHPSGRRLCSTIPSTFYSIYANMMQRLPVLSSLGRPSRAHSCDMYTVGVIACLAASLR